MGAVMKVSKRFSNKNLKKLQRAIDYTGYVENLWSLAIEHSIAELGKLTICTRINVYDETGSLLCYLPIIQYRGLYELLAAYKEIKAINARLKEGLGIDKVKYSLLKYKRRKYNE